VFFNIIKVAIRQFKRQNIYSIMNLLGLTVSISCSLLLFLYLRDEFSYDRMHPQSENLYRLKARVNINGNELETPTTPSSLGPAVSRSQYCRITTYEDVVLGYDAKPFYESHIYAVDSNFLSFFGFEVLQMKRDSQFAAQDIILTRSLAFEIFANSNPIGNELRFNNELKVVIGVVEDPVLSHMDFSALVLRTSAESWIDFTDHTYIRTERPPQQLYAELQEIYHDSVEPFFVANSGSCEFFVQPVIDIHLDSNLRGELSQGGNRKLNYAFMIVGFLLLLTAAINYANMSIARSNRRAKEIGIRKAIGSYQSDLVRQFLLESMLLVFFGVFVSLIVIDLLYPYFNYLTGSSISPQSGLDWVLILFLLLIIVFVGILGGIYPAFYMARFNAADILKGTFLQYGHYLSLKRLLVIVQYALSVLLIFCTWVILDQLQFTRQQHQTWENNDPMFITLPESSQAKFEKVKEQFMATGLINHIGSTQVVPGIAQENLTSLEIESAEGYDEYLVKYFSADGEFVESLGLNITEGTNFGEQESAREQALINSTLAEMIPGGVLGKRIRLPFPNTHGLNFVIVVGVLEDTYLKSLHEKVQPLVILYDPLNTNLVLGLTQKGPAQLEVIEAAFHKVYPSSPFDYSFATDSYESLYVNDYFTARLFGIFAIITFLLSLLGVFSLSYYSSEFRKKEIGIRKINGASNRQILVLINREYVIMILLAAAISFPLAYIFLTNWLGQFAYRIEINFWAFATTILVTLLVTLATVTVNSSRAVRSDIPTTLNQG